MPENQPRKARAGAKKAVHLADSAHGPGASDLTIAGIGASAGGLDAFRKLLDGLPSDTGMAFILVQHLDPTHESLMVELLASHTAMPVIQAAQGMTLEPGRLYVIPPGVYLSAAAGALHLSEPEARHGARMPFDFLLQSLARMCGPRAVAVVLSGTGADGSLGLKAIKDAGGLTIAQNPDEAGYDGMPRSAIATGQVDRVLPAADIGPALASYKPGASGVAKAPVPSQAPAAWLAQVVDLLRERTALDFRLYKHGTLQRRIERRMALAGIEADAIDRYLDILKKDSSELARLGNDLLINVTSFFRDPKVFALLADKIIPDLVRAHPQGQALRIWIAGCSTGEETYSLAMLFVEQIAAAKRNIKLQVFASDLDPSAIATAREGLYPDTIEADVSPERLARFFSKEERHYRVLPALRLTVVFTVQDVLSDPPFSRLDLISCRNLMIYFGPEAQAKVLAHFHFALRTGGYLLLGLTEAVGPVDGRFEVVSKSQHLYRRIGRGRVPEFDPPTIPGQALRALTPAGRGSAPLNQTVLADVCRQLVLDAYAPAAVLINAKHECLYFQGPTDRYLRVAAGAPTHDLLAMARQDIRTKLRSAIQRARQDNARITVRGGEVEHDGVRLRFGIDVRPVRVDGEPLLLICFVDEVQPPRKGRPAVPVEDLPRIAALEQELDATRTELESAIRNLEMSAEEQKAVNQEALSVNEEFQSTNEELLTSKEELQSLNEELTALNGQLQETLDRQRTTSNDLQNVLYSTDVATLFLDKALNIRLFTPAAKALFGVIAGDVGRPLTDLSLLGADSALPADCRTVLRTLKPEGREIETQAGVWFMRRIYPYRTHDDRVDGVVITFTDITERKAASLGWERARQQAELANVAKSRFLAAASHDLRQPLQTLALLHGLLAKAIAGEKAEKLFARLDETLGAMSGMLNALLDINQIEAGTVNVETIDFPLNDLLERLKGEFSYHAQAQDLELKTVGCGAFVHSDPRLLEQMLRNLLSNALKYTKRGKILLGCRRAGAMLRIEVWDTGIGIPAHELEAIFGEYHQLDNAARERSRGLGLGLSIVQSLANLLGHAVSVRSQLGKGSVFSVELPLAAGPTRAANLAGAPATPGKAAHRTGVILVVEDDPVVCDLLELVLMDEGHSVFTAPDGPAALKLVAQRKALPDVILTDYNLPGGMHGLQLAAKLREALHRQVPVIVLTGDIATDTLRDVARHDCEPFSKPVNVKDLVEVIQRRLPAAGLGRASPANSPAEVRAPMAITVIDDDSQVRAAIRAVLEDDGRTVRDYASGEDFLRAYRPGQGGCIPVDAYLPGMDGLEVLQRLSAAGQRPPVIVITGSSDVGMAVQAMKAGASDFIEKPIGRGELLQSVARALDQARDANALRDWRQSATEALARLTPRQREIMDKVLAGHPNKNIAADLRISQRTVENHRAAIMKKTGAASLPALARLAMAAADAKH
jgi:two-component system CheB/CheR fusion protein